jgi:putative transposase
MGKGENLPWKERKPLDEKRSFIAEWERQEESLAELCRRYEISRQTGYKWLERYQQEGESGLEEHCGLRSIIRKPCRPR